MTPPTPDYGASMPADVAERLADILLDGQPVTAGTCQVCGRPADLLVGGHCTGCWADRNDESTPPAKITKAPAGDTTKKRVA